MQQVQQQQQSHPQSALSEHADMFVQDKLFFKWCPSAMSKTQRLTLANSHFTRTETQTSPIVPPYCALNESLIIL